MDARKTIVFFILIFSFLAGSQAVRAQGKIYGQWKSNQFGFDMNLMLRADGTGEFDGDPIEFKIHGNFLTIILDGSSTEYKYALLDNFLELSGGDLDGVVRFSKESEEVKGGATTVVPNFSGTADQLIGLWAGNGEMIEFRADGMCVYLGNTFPYKASQGRIVLNTNQGNVPFEYSIGNGRLTLIANGQRVVYTKPAGTDGVAKKNVPALGRIPKELLGQWCYLNMSSNSQSTRCITLNADGTYIYSAESSRSVNTNDLTGGIASQNGDQGRWYVDGDRIYYQSQTQGNGSYRLEKRNHPKNVNDPMIVLDGESFVTTTQRPPWR